MSRKILVADDSATFRAFFKHLLEDSGSTVVEASDGKEALEMVKSEMPDCIILDYNMPEINGFDVCLKIREEEELRDLPIVIITAEEGPQIKAQAFDVGATDFFTKELAKGFLPGYIEYLFQSRETPISRGTVLVAEGSKLIRRGIAAYLGSANIKVFEVGCGADALKILREQDIMTVITSFTLPDMKEAALVKEIKKEAKDFVPIIVVSVRDTKADIANAFLAGASDYILTPFQRNEFLSRVYSYLELGRMRRDLATQVAEIERKQQQILEISDELIPVAESLSGEARKRIKSVVLNLQSVCQK